MIDRIIWSLTPRWQEPSFNSNACREKMIEIMFEKYKVLYQLFYRFVLGFSNIFIFQVPAVFVAKNAVSRRQSRSDSI
jgi:hypothetical protein